jgi:hypothetical protein
MMLKRMLSAVVLLLVLAFGGFAQGVCNRYAEPQAGYSLCVPQGWTVEDKENQKYKLILGPSDTGLTPNIHFIDESNPLALADYAAGSAKYAVEHYAQIGATSMRMVSQSNFRTTSGTPAIRIAYLTEFKGSQIRTLQYYFGDTDNRKLIVTCTFPEAQKETLDPLFERALKSFRFDK